MKEAGMGKRKEGKKEERKKHNITGMGKIKEGRQEIRKERRKMMNKGGKKEEVDEGSKKGQEKR